MVLRLPEGAGKKARFEAFKGTVTDILEKAEQRGVSGYRDLDSKYLQVCPVLLHMFCPRRMSITRGFRH